MKSTRLRITGPRSLIDWNVPSSESYVNACRHPSAKQADASARVSAEKSMKMHTRKSLLSSAADDEKVQSLV